MGASRDVDTRSDRVAGRVYIDDVCYALRRARDTDAHCAAVYRYRSRKTGEWVEGLCCNLEPGHDGEHGEWLDGEMTYNTSFGSVYPGGVDVSRWSDTDTPDALDGGEAVPSPWTEAELNAWRNA